MTMTERFRSFPSMKLKLLTVLALAGCEDFTQLADNARRRAADAGPSADGGREVDGGFRTDSGFAADSGMPVVELPDGGVLALTLDWARNQEFSEIKAQRLAGRVVMAGETLVARIGPARVDNEPVVIAGRVYDTAAGYILLADGGLYPSADAGLAIEQVQNPTLSVRQSLFGMAIQGVLVDAQPDLRAERDGYWVSSINESKKGSHFKFSTSATVKQNVGTLTAPWGGSTSVAVAALANAESSMELQEFAGKVSWQSMPGEPTVMVGSPEPCTPSNASTAMAGDKVFTVAQCDNSNTPWKLILGSWNVLTQTVSVYVYNLAYGKDAVLKMAGVGRIEDRAYIAAQLKNGSVELLNASARTRGQIDVTNVAKVSEDATLAIAASAKGPYLVVSQAPNSEVLLPSKTGQAVKVPIGSTGVVVAAFDLKYQLRWVAQVPGKNRIVSNSAVHANGKLFLEALCLEPTANAEGDPFLMCQLSRTNSVLSLSAPVGPSGAVFDDGL
jgi:hypothetical protein